MKVFYDSLMAGSLTAFDTTRKAQAVARSLVDTPVPGVNVAVIHPAIVSLAETLVSQVHDLDYLRALITGEPRDLAETNTFTWDPDIYSMALAHSSGVVAAMVDAVEGGHTGGTLSSGLHHARRHEGAGYCTLNGIAAACWWVSSNHPDVRVVVLDLDAHFGGGTADMIEGMRNVTQVDVSTHSFDSYDSPDALLVTPDSYPQAVAWAIDRVLAQHPDIVVYNAGVDPHSDGVASTVLAARDRCVAERLRHAEVPAVFTLAGGYTNDRFDMDDLVELHRNTIGAFA